MTLRPIAALIHLLLAVALLGPVPALAAVASDWVRTPESAVRVISGVDGVGERADLPLGLEFEMAPGWKTYWRSPGDAGYPVSLDLTGSENVADAEVLWPAPVRFSVLGIDTVGYEGEVILPLVVRPERPGEPVHLSLSVDYLTCDDVCIPQQAELHLALTTGAATPSDFAHVVDRARGSVPAGPSSLLGIDEAGIARSGEEVALQLLVSGMVDADALDAFVEAGDAFVFGRPRSTVLEPSLTLVEVPVTHAGEPVGALAGRELRTTLVAGDAALEQAIHPADAPLVTPEAEATLGLAALLGIALLGGLVLNLMPCVLPVLSIKVASLAGHAGRGRGPARAGMLATAAGILFSFWLLATAAIAVKMAGHAVGWGIQFQQPVFVSAMILVLALFAANLWGLFGIRLPGFVGDVGARTPSHGLGGAFVTGMFATLLATPCSAPFVGTAVGFALARGPGEIASIFTALGLGLALPYLVVAAAPGLADRLPRPGRWMVTLRAVMGVALVGTAIWLASVLWALSGWETTLVVGGAATAAIGWLALARGWRPLARAGGVATLAFVAFLALPVLDGAATRTAMTVGAGIWTDFERERIDRLVEEGRLVVVDVTADWCITCKVNKAAVLDRPPVVDLLGEGDVVAMQADWTRPDARISAYLAEFGRYGIPFNAVYGPGAPDGIALPELLTATAILDAVKAARSPSEDTEGTAEETARAAPVF